MTENAATNSPGMREAPALDPVSEIEPRGGRAASYALAAFATILSGATAFVSVFFLPWRIGAIAAPWVLIVGGAVVFWSVSACFQLTRSLWWAALPVLAWLGVCGWLSRSVILGYATMLADWRGQVLLVAGALAGAVGLGLAWGAKTLDRVRAAGDGDSPAPVGT